MLLGVSMGEAPPALPQGRENIRTHLAMQALLGCAERGGMRRGIISECWRLLTGIGAYADSRES